jgi:ATP-dependent helicase/DNAse subunit B
MKMNEKSREKVLVYAAPGTGLQEAIHAFADHLRQDPFASWMILPTDRLCRHVREVLTRSRIVLLPDHICTLDEMCEFFVDQYGTHTSLIRRDLARVLLLDLIMNYQEQLPLFSSNKAPNPQFVHDLQIMMQVIIRREIDYPTCLRELQSEKSEQISRLITLYHTTLHEKNIVDQDTMLSWVITFLSSHDASTMRTIIRHVHFFGLFEPMALEKRLIAKLAAISETCRYTMPSGLDPGIFADKGDWFFHDYEEIIPSHKHVQQLTAIFSHDPKDGDLLYFPHISAMGFQDPVAEMTEVAREIARLSATGVPYEDIAIATPDFRSTYGYASEICTDFGIPLQPSQGPLLTRSPLIAYYLSIFDFIEKGCGMRNLCASFKVPIADSSGNLCQINNHPINR